MKNSPLRCGPLVLWSLSACTAIPPLDTPLPTTDASTEASVVIDVVEASLPPDVEPMADRPDVTTADSMPTDVVPPDRPGVDVSVQDATSVDAPIADLLDVSALVDHSDVSADAARGMDLPVVDAAPDAVIRDVPSLVDAADGARLVDAVDVVDVTTPFDAADATDVRAIADVPDVDPCGHPCVAAHGTAACVGGACAVTTCNAGYADCNRVADDGCETDVNSSADNCGTCARRCDAAPGASTACVAGRCQLTCTGSFGNCDGLDANGCEVDLSMTASRCGRCDRACASSDVCAAGVCVCRAGTTRCGAACVTLDTDLSNCGACGRVCGAVANGFPNCVAGTCGATCLTDRGNCNASLADGCETDLSRSDLHCGACGHACSTGTVCLSGSCVATGTNLLANPSFEDTTDVLYLPAMSYAATPAMWQTYEQDNVARGSCAVVAADAADGLRFARCGVTMSSLPSFYFMLMQVGMSVTGNRQYVVMLRARANAPRTLSVTVSRNSGGAPHIPGDRILLSIGTSWAEYRGDFTACVRDNSSGVEVGPCVSGLADSDAKFGLELAYGPGQIEVDDVRFFEIR